MEQSSMTPDSAYVLLIAGSIYTLPYDINLIAVHKRGKLEALGARAPPNHRLALDLLYAESPLGVRPAPPSLLSPLSPLAKRQRVSPNEGKRLRPLIFLFRFRTVFCTSRAVPLPA